MAHHIQLILQQSVDHLGQAGDLVRVRAGYARNFLVPRSMAVVASTKNVKQIEHHKRIAQALAAKQLQEAEAVAKMLNELQITIAKPTGEKGRLFGSVTSQEIAKILLEKGYEVEKRKLSMPEDAIKEVGTYDISAKLSSQVQATFKLEVVSE